MGHTNKPATSQQKVSNKAMNFSEKLKKAAKELNLTQVQMAGMTGKSKASVSYTHLDVYKRQAEHSELK